MDAHPFDNAEVLSHVFNRSTAIRLKSFDHRPDSLFSHL
jgi:hypothetical protein